MGKIPYLPILYVVVTSVKCIALFSYIRGAERKTYDVYGIMSNKRFLICQKSSGRSGNYHILIFSFIEIGLALPAFI